MKINMKGVGVALITPFQDNGAVDYEALGRLLDRVNDGGADYLVVLGTTAETPTLNAAERDEIKKFVIEKNAGRLPIVIGIGGNSTADVVAAIRAFDFTGVDAVLSVTPFYNKPSQEGLFQHYKAVAEASPRPVVMYNVPGRTGVNMSAQTTLRLARECSNIIAIKEASGNLSQVSYILRDRPEGFFVISGDDNLTFPMVALGGDGVISVAVNAFPEKFCKMVHGIQAGDTSVARAHLEMMEATDALFAEGNPVGVKSALTYYGVIRNNLRLPLVHSSEQLDARIQILIETYQLK